MRIRLRLLLALALPALVAALLLAADVSRPPSRQVTARLAISAIHWYQASVSPRLGAQCRFKPTCSQYAAESIRRYGIVRGGWRAAWRVARCGPWTKKGTVDPP